jgi:dolichol-phosphate mannosyltransferase
MNALVIIPTYNEMENLPRIVPAVLSQDDRLSVLIVDDNSPDGTGRLADEMAQTDPRIFVLHRPGKAGLGKAYLAGFRWALERDYDRIFEMDADFSHDFAVYIRCQRHQLAHWPVIVVVFCQCLRAAHHRIAGP